MVALPRVFVLDALCFGFVRHVENERTGRLLVETEEGQSDSFWPADLCYECTPDGPCDRHRDRYRLYLEKVMRQVHEC